MSERGIPPDPVSRSSLSPGSRPGHQDLRDQTRATAGGALEAASGGEGGSMKVQFAIAVRGRVHFPPARQILQGL